MEEQKQPAAQNKSNLFDPRFHASNIKDKQKPTNWKRPVIIILVILGVVAIVFYVLWGFSTLNFTCTQDNRGQSTCSFIFKQKLPAECPPNCSNMDFSRANLSGVDWSWAKFNKSNLTRAELRQAQLYSGQFKGADLSRADLRWVMLLNGQLSEANLQHANLGWTDLRSTNLDNANFRGADLFEAQLTSSSLRGADFTNADLTGATLHKSNSREAIFFNANLQDTNLTDALLIAVDFRNATLQNADLRRADLREANLNGANLTGARYNTITAWPKGFNPDAHGAVFKN